MNLRRRLLLALGAGAMLPAGARAQPRVWRVGFLAPQRRPKSLEAGIFGAFVAGMREAGYVEGRNLSVEWRFADDRYDRLPELAADLVRVAVDAIVTIGTAGTRAAQRATSTIPIVMGSVNDPVASGFVKSLARPGGNITGFSNIAVDVTPKLLEMLQAIVPRLVRVAVLIHPDNPSHGARLGSLETAARKAGVDIVRTSARSTAQIETAFGEMTAAKAQALIVARDTFFTAQSAQIAQLAARQRLASIAGVREFPEAGGLMSYGSSLSRYFRRAAVYVDRIFKGASPADLPVEEPVALELVINRATAKALGLGIPQSLLTIADQVID